MSHTNRGVDTWTPVASLPLDPRILAILRADGIERLYPPQSEALAPVLAGRSVVLACPTASGKSLVAYLALATAYLKGGKGLYIVPLRALASEKYHELRAFEKLGMRVGITMGEHDITSQDLENLDVLVATSEKADSLLRHKSRWMEGVSVVVADEAHLLRERTRGPTLEITLSRLRRHHPTLQVIALSATIANSAELAAWLDAAHVSSIFRPVKLRMGTYSGEYIHFLDGEHRKLDGTGDPTEKLTRTVIEGGGQALVFVSTRRNSESLAERLATTVERLLTKEESEGLQRAARKLGHSGEEATSATRKLSSLVARGAAYHNASLTNPERLQIETAFRSGLLKCIVATPTLAAGVNLPARRVIIRDLTRYEETLGITAPLPTFEVQQMCGRAGRPRYDPYGEAVLVTRSEEEGEDVRERYLLAPPEEVDSKLASEAVLRTHLLALVASDEVRNEADLRAFMQGTFYGHKLPVRDLEAHIFLAQEFLEKHDLLRRGELRATPFGKLASDLYLDPVTAVLMRMALRRATEETGAFPYLAAVAGTPDVAPMYLRRDDYAVVAPRAAQEERQLLLTEEDELLDLEEESFLSTIKTAMVVEEWIDDRRPLSALTETYGIGAGDLHARVERMEWLLSSMAQLARWEHRSLANRLDELSVRVRYGIRSELLDLVMLRGIGRVRGRLLYERGITSQEQLSRTPEDTVATILGSKPLAREVLAQVRLAGSAEGSHRKVKDSSATQRNLLETEW
jgi:helicase